MKTGNHLLDPPDGIWQRVVERGYWTPAEVDRCVQAMHLPLRRSPLDYDRITAIGGYPVLAPVGLQYGPGDQTVTIEVLATPKTP